MSSANSEFENNLKTILKILSDKILDLSEKGYIKEEYIYNIALNLRNTKNIPFYPRSIGHFGAYSIDIHYCIKILEALGFLSHTAHQIATRKTFHVNSHVGNSIDFDQILYEKEILKSCAAKLENESFEYENGICDTYFDFLEKEYNYLFTHLGCLDHGSSTKVDLEQIGIDDFRSLTRSEPKEKSGKRGYEERILSKLGENILSHCNDLFPYNLRLASLKKAYYNYKEKIEGKLVSVIGIFDEYERIPGNYLYEFRDSIVLGIHHRIHALFGENGKFLCRKPALSNRECFLLGFVDSFSGEVALRAAGVIKIDPEYGSVPAHVTVPKALASQRTESSAIIVGEKNGTETHILGGDSI